MSELKAFTFTLGRYTEDGYPCVVAVDDEDNPRLAYDEKFYLKSEADKVIAEKDKEIAELKAKLDKAIAERDGNQVCIDALKKKLENVQASMYCDVVDANMENRKLRRALWIARAKRAIEKIAWFKLWNASISTMNPEDGARQEFDKWKKALGKFLKKAEEYK